MNREYVERLKEQFPGPLTDKERKLLQDMRFLIDFVLDHNLSMELAVEVLEHDIVEGIRYHGSLAKAKGFAPKSHEFSNY